MATTDLYFDLTNQQFIQSAQQPQALNTLSWYYGSVKRLRVKFVTRTSAQQVTVADPTGWAVQMAIGDAAATPTVDTSATGTGPTDGWILFTLQLNVAAVATALGTADQVQRDLEFQITPVASEPEKYQTKINLRSRLITTTLVDPTPPAVAISSAEALALFVPRDGSNSSYPCDSFIMVDKENSSLYYLVSITAGQWHIDPL